MNIQYAGMSPAVVKVYQFPNNAYQNYKIAKSKKGKVSSENVGMPIPLATT